MNEIIYKFLLAGDTFMSEMHPRQPGFTYSAYGLFTANKERIKKLKEKETQNRFIKMNQIKLAFSTMWHMEILRIYLKERWMIKYYVIKHLIVLKIKNMILSMWVCFNGL